MEVFAVAGGGKNGIVLEPSLPQPKSSTLVSGLSQITVTQIIAGSEQVFICFLPCNLQACRKLL